MHGTQEHPRLEAGTLRGNPHLHAAIIEAGLTYEELADRLGVDPKTVERWVNAPGRRPYARHAQAVARVLGVDTWELWPALRRSETPAPAPASTHEAKAALAKVESLNLATASATELALHLGALSSSLRSLLASFNTEAVAR
jgi:transcriptional regulator with XRE-family HTH domain